MRGAVMPTGANNQYFCNTSCEFFPCHSKADPEHFNCLFCYCPLYALGPRCGGSFSYIDGKIKDCSACLIPHSKGGYAFVLEKVKAIQELAYPPEFNER